MSSDVAAGWVHFVLVLSPTLLRRVHASVAVIGASLLAKATGLDDMKGRFPCAAAGRTGRSSVAVIVGSRGSCSPVCHYRMNVGGVA